MTKGIHKKGKASAAGSDLSVIVEEPTSTTVQAGGGGRVAFVPGWSWTEQETAIVRERYLTDGARKLANELGRSCNGVFRKAQRLGLVRYRTWARKDDLELEQMLADGLGLARIAGRLKRSEQAIWNRARHLGLPLGRPQDFEYFTLAARRVGVSPQTLRKIMRAAEQPILLAQSQPGRRGRYRRHIVDPVNVDSAVEEWLSTEVVGAAERRYGVPYGTIHRLLVRAGIKPRENRKQGAQWRVKSEIIERLIADWLADRPIERRAA